MAMPLMMLGPGGQYVSRYEPRGRKMFKTVAGTQGQPDSPDTESGSSYAGYARYPRGSAAGADVEEGATVQVAAPADTFEHGEAPMTDRRWVKAGSLAAAVQAIDAWLAQQRFALDLASDQLAGLRPPKLDPRRLLHIDEGHAMLRRLMGDYLAADLYLSTEHDHVSEADPEAEEDSFAYPRLATDPRLFPDLAGARRRVERQQGDDLRARGSARKERRPDPRSKQGSLFGAVG